MNFSDIMWLSFVGLLIGIALLDRFIDKAQDTENHMK